MRGGSPVHRVILGVVAVAHILVSAALGGSGPNDLAIVQLLLAHGADVNAKANNGARPLSLALQGGPTEITKLLRKHGAKE